MEAVSEVELRESDEEILRREAERVKPVEACALLTGKIKEGCARISQVYLAQNIDASTASFTVDPELVLKVVTEAEQRGEGLAAIFHSHGASAAPSELDRYFMKLNPVVWLISSLNDGSLEAYQWQVGSIRRLTIRRPRVSAPQASPHQLSSSKVYALLIASLTLTICSLLVRPALRAVRM
ncbi:MAG: M67 family metallopeptidase [Candidatus Bathyarchaeia archaeon]